MNGNIQTVWCLFGTVVAEGFGCDCGRNVVVDIVLVMMVVVLVDIVLAARLFVMHAYVLQIPGRWKK